MHIHLTGAAGTGTTTLGRALAAELGLAFLDTDDFYWLPTNPPFTQKSPLPERLNMLTAALGSEPEGWVLSGSLMEWGDPLIPQFDLVVFLYVEAEERLKRLKVREAKRHGPAIELGGPLHAQHQEFLAWAAGYETGALGGRSLPTHLAWLEKLPCTVLRLEGTLPLEESLTRTRKALENRVRLA